MLSTWNSGYREWFFYGISFLALLALFIIYNKSKVTDRKIHIPLALILGGAIGNLIDRWRFGNVVDFLRFHWQETVTNFEIFGKPIRIYLSWPSFNVADVAITCGALALIIVLIFFDSKKPDNNISALD